MKLFDPKFYEDAYNDLNGLSVQSLKLHYLNYGHNENRLPSVKYFEQLYGIKKSNQTIKELVEIHASHIPKGDITLDPPGNKHMFDGKYYRETYPDVVAAGFDTSELALKHWLSYGKNENRIPNRGYTPGTATDHPPHTNIVYEDYWPNTGDSLVLDIPGKNFGGHYYGWKGVMTSLYNNIKSNGVVSCDYGRPTYLNPWLEELTTWGDAETNKRKINDIKNKNMQFITFIHNPPFPEWESKYSFTTPTKLEEFKYLINTDPQSFNGFIFHTDITMVSNEQFFKNCDRQLLDNSVYIYTVSQEHKKYLTTPEIQQKYPFLKNKILSVTHPITDAIESKFNYTKFSKLKTKKLFHIGWWQRNLKSFNDIKLPLNLEKNVLIKNTIEKFSDTISKACPNVELISHIENDEYIKIFETSILYMDVFDVTASNLLLECIRCETPIILKRHPALEQYIGAEYPLFFDNVTDIENLNEKQLMRMIREANKYLSSLDKTHISQQTLNEKICYDLSKLKKPDPRTPKLSWVTSMYNADQYLDDMVNDFLSQNSRYPNELEWVIVSINDSHNKKTQKKIYKLSQQYHNIKVLYYNKSEDPGIYNCWKLGIQVSTGKYITNANLDDRHDTNYSIKMIDFLDSTPVVDIAFAPVHVGKEYLPRFDNKALKNCESWFREFHAGVPLHLKDFWSDAIKDTCNPCHATPVWRRDIHTIIGWFDEQTYGSVADYAFWLKCVSCNLNIMKCSDHPLSYYPIIENSYGRSKMDNKKKHKLIKQYNLHRDV
jgi:hypothetical protein